MEKIEFDSADPFPLISISEYNYAAAKAHAISVDQHFNFNFQAVEDEIVNTSNLNVSLGKQNWKGLPVQTLMTPYIEIRTMLELINLQDGELIIDLGCAYARMAHVIQRHYSMVKYLGIELEPLRVQAALSEVKNYQNPNLTIQCQDLADPDFKPPQAKCYFIYDFGSHEDIQKTLQDLKEISRSNSIQVIARGRKIRHEILVKNPWLGEVIPAQHFETFSLFKSS